MPNFREIHDRTFEVYNQYAKAWDSHRRRVFYEKAWLERFASVIPARSSVLDVGCGAGEPITAYLIERGFSVTGIDLSPAMIKLSHFRFPEMDCIVMDMRDVALKGKFHGIIGWDSFFHLDPDEQRSTLQRFFRLLHPGGAVLLTVGHEASEVLGKVEGEPVYHSSLDPEEYRQIFRSAGFDEVDIVIQDEACGYHTVLLATQQKKRSV